MPHGNECVPMVASEAWTGSSERDPHLPPEELGSHQSRTGIMDLLSFSSSTRRDPKAGGGVRKLGVPTILDRVLQQAAHQILSPCLNPSSANTATGFVPDAVPRMRSNRQQYQEEGKNWVVDLDLKAFFDEVNHDLLMARVRRHVKDKHCSSSSAPG